MPERTDQPAGQPTPQPCPSCNGSGGTTVDTVQPSGERISQHQPCTGCGGSGRRYY